MKKLWLFCVVIFGVVQSVYNLSTLARKLDALIVDPQPFANSTEAIVDELNGQQAREIPIRYHGAQLWRIDYNDQTKKNVVVELQDRFAASMWNLNADDTVDMMMHELKLEEAKELLDKSNIPYTVLIEDLQKAIDEENPSTDDLDLWENRNGHRMTWSAYHRLDDIHDYLDFLAKTFPDLCSVQSIGQSVEKRDMKVLRISNGNQANKAIWLDGGIHAREWISPATVTYIINRLVEEWDDQPEYIRNIDWYVLPVVNPDGYEYTHKFDRLWRKNRGGVATGRCAGVDLNRNFGYKWGGQGASRQPCAETFAGSSAFSEPESKALKNFMENSAASFKAYLSFHSYGQYILYPWGYDRVVPPDHEDLDRVGKLCAARMKAIGGQSYSVGPSGSLLYPAAGASDDYARGTLRIKYSYTVELRDSGRYGFILPASQIDITGQETMALIDVVAKAVSEL